jgi:hypothetical protein
MSPCISQGRREKFFSPKAQPCSQKYAHSSDINPLTRRGAYAESPSRLSPKIESGVHEEISSTWRCKSSSRSERHRLVLGLSYSDILTK